MSWIQTYTGGRFYPLSPRAEDVDINDIAHALSMKCRFGGHSRWFYSVAEHSVHVSMFCSPENALWALLHDAAEAYLPDVCRPIKHHLAGFDQIETSVLDAICERFGLDLGMPDEVKRLDTMILADERAQIMPLMQENVSDANWGAHLPPLGATIACWEPAEAEHQFKARFFELQVKAV